MLKQISTLIVLLSISSSLLAADSMADLIKQASIAPYRSSQHIARNRYRHPVQTLQFFGLKKGMTLVEITPGGMWYTEILAPVLKGNGHYIAASYDPDLKGQPAYQYRQTAMLQKRFASEPEFSEAKIAKFSPPGDIDLGAPGSADMVVTFRNTHNWIHDGSAQQVYNAFFKVLKPGGVLGVVDHRGPAAWGGYTGYITEKQVIELAQKAGFVLEARSEINANPRDTKNYPENVWTLPPTLRLGQTDRAKYLDIGESDRMTLRFRKPR